MKRHFDQSQVVLISLTLLTLLFSLLNKQTVECHFGRLYKNARVNYETFASSSYPNRSEGRKFPILRAIVSQFISDRSSSSVAKVNASGATQSLSSSVSSLTSTGTGSNEAERSLSSITGSNNGSNNSYILSSNKSKNYSEITLNSSSNNQSFSPSLPTSNFVRNSKNVSNDQSSLQSSLSSSSSLHHHHHHHAHHYHHHHSQTPTSAASSPVASSSLPSSSSTGVSTTSSYPRGIKSQRTSSIKTIQHIIEDINSQQSKISSKRRKHFLVNILSRMLKSVNFTELSNQMRNGISSRASCWVCNALAGLFLSPVYSIEMMTMAVNTVCTSFKLQKPRVCSGIVQSFKSDLDYIRKHTTLKHSEMCGVIFGMDCTRKITKNLNWTVDIPERQSPLATNQVKRNSHLDTMSTGVEISAMLEQDFMPEIDYRDSYKSVSKLVHITDIHVDPYYEPGSDAGCGEPLCCRATNGHAKSKDRAAGSWGDYRNCDTPVATLRHALKHISETHSDAEYWMWTGDVAPHDIWNVTREEVISQVKLVTNLIKQYSRVPVYPVIGNHEGVPVNSFPPPEIKSQHSISWLYDAVAEEWAYWLPEEALQTLRYGGYYTVKARNKLRIVCINTNYCARLNPWSLYNPIDPANQLEWLARELHKAEVTGDKVHIIGHIPPDNRECTQAWLWNFLRIIDRFNNTVLAQYYGHTHRDEYRLFYSPDEKRNETPVGLAYIGPSITPFTENNPGYRLYYMDDMSNALTDHETFFFNLTEANLGNHGPQWKQEYRFTQKFNTDSLTPQSFHDLMLKMQDDNKLFNKFKNLYYRYSEPKREERCTDQCKEYILSDLAVLHPLNTSPKRFLGRRKHKHN